jgi:branched-subunit amino acid transport protein
MSPVAVILVAGLMTYLLRFVPIALLHRYEPPAWLDRSGRFVAPVAFAALAAVALASAAPEGPAVLLPRVAALGAAAVTVMRTRSTWATIAVGMATLWLTSQVIAQL